MNVGLSLLTLFPGRVGGSETYVRGLLDGLAATHEHGCVNVLANRHVMAAYHERIPGPGMALHHVRSYRAGDSGPTRAGAMALAALAPRSAARDVPPGLEVMHYPVTVPIPRVGTPSVVTVHDIQHRERPQAYSRGERLYRRWAYDGSARSATVVVAVSRYMKQALIETLSLDPARIEVVHLGIDHARFTTERAGDAALLAPLHLPDRYLVYPANLWPQKNHERLMAALVAVEDRSLHLVLAGQTYGRLPEVMAAARHHGVADRVHHAGFIAPEVVPALLRRARAMVFPSLYEGFGAPPLEAMACGCPVASSTRGSLGEVCGDAVVPFEPEDPAAIADAIDRVTGDDALRGRLREAGLLHARRFSWTEAATRHRAIYARAADRNSAPAHALYTS